MIRQLVTLLTLALVALPAAAQSTRTTTYVYTDHLGSPIMLVEAGTRNVVWQAQYGPFGEVVAESGTPADRPGYTGHYRDVPTGLVYMQQRYYDPAAGRFLSVDPVAARETGDNFNRYWYANNNPYKFIDPNGEDAYLVSRPLKIGGRWYSHNFIVSHAEFPGDPDAAVYSWGRNREGMTGRVFDSTHADDVSAWLALQGSDADHPDITPLQADDRTVMMNAQAVLENTPYRHRPRPDDDSTNSNSASSAVANRSDGKVVEVPGAPRTSPGSEVGTRIRFRERER